VSAVAARTAVRTMHTGDARERPDWSRIERDLDAEGVALLPGFFDAAQVHAMHADFDAAAGGASLFEEAPTGEGVDMPLPAPWPGFLVRAREALSLGLVPIAARWRACLDAARGDGAGPAGIGLRPGDDDPFARSHLRLLRAGEWRPLRSAAEDDAHRHPFLLVALLSEPGRDFTGGELVMTERRPRMQSRPIVLPLRRGDAALVAAGPRPCQGTHGTYRTHLRQAVGRVRSGERLGLWLRLDGG